MSKKYKPDDLDGYVFTTTDISCSKCSESDTTGGDEYEAMKYFFNKGWRATPNNCYCPKCAKKYLKSK